MKRDILTLICIIIALTVALITYNLPDPTVRLTGWLVVGSWSLLGLTLHFTRR